MITQNIIEEFFLKMIEELRKENIPILNNYCDNFKNYQYEQDIVDKEEEINREIEDDYYDEVEAEN
jgi:Ran GTPase-activating protein (RanGAP) involved in mRNA processing and transport